MMRTLMAGLAGLALCACTVRADDEQQKVKGKVAQYDPAQRILKIKVGERERTFKVRADAEIVDQNGQPIPEDAQADQVAPGAQVTLVTQSQGAGQGPQQVSRVQIQVVRTKKKPGTEQTPPGKPKAKDRPEQSPNQTPPKPKTKPEQTPPEPPK